MGDITLNLAQRTEFTLKGLQDLIRSVFTDEDANGNNGEDYYYSDEPFNDYLDRRVEEWYKHGESEEIIVGKAFGAYDEFCGSYYFQTGYEYTKNDKKQITSLAFAAYVR